jgi:hypothetical protein
MTHPASLGSRRLEISAWFDLCPFGGRSPGPLTQVMVSSKRLETDG